MDLSNFIVSEETSVLDAAAVINQNHRKIVFVCDGLKLLAVFSDGDLRRYILRAGDLSKPVSFAANYKPVMLTADRQADARNLFRQDSSIRGIPVVNADGELVSIIFADHTSVYRNIKLNIPVVIMAGGKGTRLAPYTDVLPKPLIPVSNRTITEHIMESFLNAGCNDFIMIVNHKKELIKAYFNEMPYEGSLRFVDEGEFQGTGGGLKLLEGMLSSTFFVINCDTLVDADFGNLLKHHRESGCVVTMVCALKKTSIPFGTVELDEEGNLIKLVERPEYPYLANTGLYVIEPEFLKIIKPGEFVHITELIQRLMVDNKHVGVYPVSESSWMDMGQPDELKKMSRALMG